MYYKIENARDEYELAFKRVEILRTNLNKDRDNDQLLKKFDDSIKLLKMVEKNYKQLIKESPKFTLNYIISILGIGDEWIKVEFHPISDAYKKYGASIVVKIDAYRKEYNNIAPFDPGTDDISGTIFVSEIKSEGIDISQTEELLIFGFHSNDIFHAGFDNSYITSRDKDTCI